MKVRTVLGELITIDPSKVVGHHLSTYSMYYHDGVALLPTASQEIELLQMTLKRNR